MSAWHFAAALAAGVYGYLLLPDWAGFLALTCAYVVWAEARAAGVPR